MRLTVFSSLFHLMPLRESSSSEATNSEITGLSYIVGNFQS